MEQEDKKSYEFSFLLSNELSESEANRLANEIQGVFIDLEGEIIREFEMKKKTLAYPVKKQDVAYFGYFHFSLEPDKIEKAKEILKYKKGILRTLIITPPVEVRDEFVGLEERKKEEEENGEREERNEEEKERETKEKEELEEEVEETEKKEKIEEVEDIGELEKEIEEIEDENIREEKEEKRREEDEKEKKKKTKKDEIDFISLEDKLKELEQNI